MKQRKLLKSRRARRILFRILLISILISVFFIQDVFQHVIFAQSRTINASPGDVPDASFAAAEKVRVLLDDPVWNQFEGWARENSESSNESTLDKGIELAKRRKALLESLIRLDPKAVRSRSIPETMTGALPPSVAVELERPFSFRGDFLVYAVDHFGPSTGEPTMDHIEREIVHGDERYEAIVSGRRLDMTTKYDIPMHGVLVAGLAVVDEDPLKELDSDGTTVTAIVGGERIDFATRTDMEAFREKQIRWESTIGPVSVNGGGPQRATSAWTTGPKTVLYIRVDFSDRPGEPVDYLNQPLTEQGATNHILNEVGPWYAFDSYGATSMSSVTVTPVVRVPQLSIYYMNPVTGTFNFGAMMTDARAAARAAGFETNNFDLDIAASINTGIGLGGYAYIGGKGTWLIGVFDADLNQHELGHNYGLVHANSWQTTDGTVIGPGQSVEYGDQFDTMGSNYGYNNARYKYRLDWISDSNVQTVTASTGVYRITNLDTSTNGGIRALRIRKDATKDYWVEFRQQFTSNPNAMNGALVRWSLTNGQTQLLDMVPATVGDVFDAPLDIGRTFYDEVNRIRITPLNKGNTNPETLDVRVERNVGCSFALPSTSQNVTASGGEVNVTVSTQAGCVASVATGENWLYPITNDDGSIRIVVTANYQGQARTGVVLIAGQSFTIEQAGLATACVSVPAGLVSWWRAEGGSGADETGRNNGTVLSGMSFGGGQVGGAFLGASSNGYLNKVDIVDSPSLALDRTFSIEGWVKFRTAGDYVLFSRGDDRDYGGTYQIGYSNGQLSFRIRVSPHGDGVLMSAPVAIGGWHHFAAVLDDATGQMELYIDGILAYEYTTTLRPYRDLDPSQSPRVSIGNIHGGLGVFDSLDGSIDELSVYNRALTAAEISAIYSAGTAATGSIGKCLIGRVQFDFDGDGKADISIFRPSNGAWYLQQSTAGLYGTLFGDPTDKITPADFDGDGRTDIAVYRPSTGIWYVINSSTGTIAYYNFGLAEDLPTPADYDGDGKADISVFRPSTATWYRQNSSDGSFYAIQFGLSGDKPTIGDFDGDGKSDIAIFRPSDGAWYELYSSDGSLHGAEFGFGTDILTPADYDGDGKTDIAVFRPTTGLWYIDASATGQVVYAVFGLSTDIPAPGDFDGDGKADLSVFRPSDGTWYRMNSSNGSFFAFQFGTDGDKPTQTAFRY